ncbi:MAG TPA: hypothetical protein VIW07_12260 [Candidatus Udaeobacter sp.]
MSTPPKPPERLAEILLEILALSDSARPSQSESISGSDQNEVSNSPCGNESQPKAEQNNNRQRL